jgi:hypothetical protein
LSTVSARRAPVPRARGVKLLEERPDTRGMPLCVDVERRELQERDKRVPVICECLREREARGRRRREGDEERCGDIGDFGRCEVLVELLSFSLCLSLGLSLGCGASGGWMEVHVGRGWVRAFLRFAAARALELQRQSTVILVLMSRSAYRNTRLAAGMLWILSAIFWKMGRPLVKLRAVPKSTWAMLRGTAGGRGRHGVPMRTDRAWRMGRDRLLSILGGWDGTDCMDRAAVPGARSVSGVVRWPTKALSIILVLWRIRMEKGDEVC